MSGRSSPPELSGEDVEDAGLLSGRRKKLLSWYAPHITSHTFTFDLDLNNHVLLTSTPVPLYPRVLRAALYGAQIFVSFFLMLVFMTYNVGPPRLFSSIVR